MEIFKEYGARIAGEKFNGKEPRSFFEIIQDFNNIVEVFDKKFTWDKVDSQSEIATSKSTVLVYGECGQGKSTTLNHIVKQVALAEKLGADDSCLFKSDRSFKSVTGCFKEGTIG